MKSKSTLGVGLFMAWLSLLSRTAFSKLPAAERCVGCGVGVRLAVGSRRVSNPSFSIPDQRFQSEEYVPFFFLGQLLDGQHLLKNMIIDILTRCA
jgi:hypothetical protein